MAQNNPKSLSFVGGILQQSICLVRYIAFSFLGSNSWSFFCCFYLKYAAKNICIGCWIDASSLSHLLIFMQGKTSFYWLIEAASCRYYHIVYKSISSICWCIIKFRSSFSQCNDQFKLLHQFSHCNILQCSTNIICIQSIYRKKKKKTLIP